MSSQILDLNDLSVSFNGSSQPALKGVSLSLQKGQTLGVVGESGSGKSLTSLALMGLLPKNASIIKGTARFSIGEDFELLGLSADEHRKIRGKHLSMIFQEPMTSLNPSLTCGYQVAEVLRFHKGLKENELEDKVLDLFARVKLPNPREQIKSYPHQLSGGQRQRVMIAMAIACNPELLIADEPTTALDVTVQKEIIDLLKELQKEHQMGMIFISHDLGVIASVAHHVAVMYKGEVVEYGEVSQILKNPKHPYTKGLIACRPPKEGRPERLLTVADFMKNELKKPLAAPLKKEKTADREEILLSIHEIQKSYAVKRNFWGQATETSTVLKGINLEVYQGETLGLVGESGCGKSTLGRVVLGLVHPEKGRIIYKGKELATDADFSRLRGRMQIIFQDPYSALNPKYTVGEAILEPMRVQKIGGSEKERRSMAIDLLEKVGLSEKQLSLYPHEFSGGQRQRICIARCLALKPEFIICDESVSALDVSVQAQVLNLLNELKKELGLTYIFISHDLSVVKYMSDRVVVMKKGQIEETGDPDRIYTHPQSSYTKRLIESIPDL